MNMILYLKLKLWGHKVEDLSAGRISLLQVEDPYLCESFVDFDPL